MPSSPESINGDWGQGTTTAPSLKKLNFALEKDRFFGRNTLFEQKAIHFERHENVNWKNDTAENEKQDDQRFNLLKRQESILKVKSQETSPSEASIGKKKKSIDE